MSKETEKEIERLERELEEMKETHKNQWKEYGSELAVGDLFRRERELQYRIDALKEK